MLRNFKRTHLRHAEEPTVNLTPLIDVVFVILIMFIVVAPLLELDQVNLANAPVDRIEDSIALQDSSAITIHVRKDNTILLNNRSVTIEQLPQLLILEKQHHPGTRPQVFHDREAYFGTYQSVKNALEAAGFQQMDIVLKPA